MSSTNFSCLARNSESDIAGKRSLHETFIIIIEVEALMKYIYLYIHIYKGRQAAAARKCYRYYILYTGFLAEIVERKKV